jgi:asparagine synthase (glutamine-hydrolysing)
MLEELTGAYSEPFGCSSALAMLRVSRAVKPYATVLLTGDGGDDIFLGYSFHQHCLKAQQWARRLPGGSAAVWSAARPLFNAVTPLRRPKHFADYITGGLGAMTRAHDGLPYYQERGLLGDRLLGMDLPHRQIPLSFSSARNLMHDFLNYQQRMWFVAEFMTKVDGGAMFYALEARSPFLDHVLWDFAAKLPPQLRLHGGVPKAILREIVRRRVSPAVAARKKQGFTIPVERWLVNQWSEELDSLTDGSLLESEGWLRRGALRAAIEPALAARQAPRQLWFLMTLEHWLRKNQPAVAGVATPVVPSVVSR